MFKTLIFLSAISLSLSVSGNGAGPVIGVWTQPANFPPNNVSNKNYSYIASSYIRALEAAGARPVPIQWDLPQSTLQILFGQINGLFFPGGGSTIVEANGSLSLWASNAQFLINLAIEAYANGSSYFPIYGVCLGSETIAISISNNTSLLINTTVANNTALNIYPTGNQSSSVTFAAMDPTLFAHLSTENLTYFHDDYAIDNSTWSLNPTLAGNLTVTSVTNNTGGGLIVTSYEGKGGLPIFGTQFHPEKNTYEWQTNETIPHFQDSTRLQQYLAQFFVNQTQLNNNSIPNSVLEELSFYQFVEWHIEVNPEFEGVFWFENYYLSGKLIQQINVTYPVLYTGL